MPEAIQSWPIAAATLTGMALILLVVAIRTGRWGLWLLAYALVVIGLAVVVAGQEHGDRDRQDAGGAITTSRPSAAGAEGSAHR